MSEFTELTDKFKKFNQYPKFVGVLDSNDYYKIASTAYEVLKSISTFLPMVKKPIPKNEKTSAAYRNMGNEMFTQKNYGDALHLYNLAALHAPVGSQAYSFALSNRSALYFRIKKFSSAVKDIHTCLSLGMDAALTAKLEKRLEDCRSMMWQEPVEHDNVMGEFNDAVQSKEFFHLSGKHNPKFPFAKNSIDLVMRDGKEYAIAQSDIQIGDLIAIEPAFVSNSMACNRLIFCYHCNKYADNLVPCETCSHALFCNETCKKLCWEQYHQFECHMMEIYNLLPLWYNNWYKFVIKTWTQSKNMEKFAEVSSRIDGFLQNDGGAIKLDINNVVSYLLPPNKDHVKKYGRLYDTAIYTALVIHGLKEVPLDVFKPASKTLFIENAAKQLMFHVMHSPEFSISGAMLPLGEEHVLVSNVDSIGVFPFLSRFQHDCDPNVTTVGLGNKLALVSSKFIKAGNELTFAYGGEYVQMTKKERQFCTYNLFGFLCNCRACIEDWSQYGGNPNEDLKSKDIEMLVQLFQYANDKKAKYRIVCDIMSKMPSSPGDKTYQVIYNMFRHLLSAYQYGLLKQRFHGNTEELEKDDLNNMFDILRRLMH